MGGKSSREETVTEPRQPRLLAQGEVTLERVCVDPPQEEGAIRRAACTAFLLAADAGQVHWHPEHLDRLLFQGAEIQKMQPEAVSNCGHPVQLRTHLTLHTIRSTQQLASSVTPQEAMQLLETVTTGCIAEWRNGATAFIKRKPEDLLVFRSGWQSPPQLLQVWNVNGLSAELSKMSHGEVTLTLLDITRRFEAHDLQPSGQAHDEYRQQLQDLPDYHKLSELRSTSAASAPQDLTPGTGMPQDLTPGTTTPEDLTPGTTTPEDLTPGTGTSQDPTHGTTTPRTPTWRVELPGVYDQQDVIVCIARSLVEGRPPGTLTEEAARLDRGCFDWGHPDTVALEGQLQRFVCDLVEAVGKRDPLFARRQETLVGSHGDGTDVRRTAVEFDILVSVAWEGVRVVREEGRGPVEYSVWVRGDALAAYRKEGWRDVLRGRPRLMKWVMWWKVDPWAFLQRWADGLAAVLPTVTLPEGLTHGGPLCPKYSVVNVGGTTVTLSLVWRGETRLTCDLTPAFPVPRDALWSNSEDAICRLEQVAGLERSSHPVHLVPGRGWKEEEFVTVWLPTTCVVETHALVALGPRSLPVTLIRGLKLLARRYLQWRPLDESEVGEARDIIAALGRGGGGSRRRIGGLVDVEGLSDCVSESLETGRVRLPERREGEGWEGEWQAEAGEGVYCSRVALVVFATHTAHRAGRGAGGCQGECGLCEDLTREAGKLLGRDTATFLHPAALLHPAVGKAVGLPPSPQLEVPSVILKYLVLTDLVRGDREVREGVEPYMRDLATRVKDVKPVEHPLVSGEGLYAIRPRSEQGQQVDTRVINAIELSRDPVWRLLPYSLFDCHNEVCRQLCDVTQVT